jgi:hypothetical protein
MISTIGFFISIKFLSKMLSTLGVTLAMDECRLARTTY